MKAEELKKIRQDLNVTQDEMALFLGCNRRTYQRYESGSAIPALLDSLLSYKVKCTADGKWIINSCKP